MSQHATGGFGDSAMEKSVAKNMFVPATIKNIYFSKKVEYVSGPVGRKIRHTGFLNSIERRADSDDSSVSIRDAVPDTYIQISIPSLHKRMTLRMKPSQIIQFGEFTSPHSSFKLTETEISVKIRSGSVVIKDIGEFSKCEEDDRHLDSYSSHQSRSKTGLFDYRYKCGEVVDARLLEAWAKDVGLYNSMWVVTETKDSEYSNTASIVVEPKHEEYSDWSIRFSFVIGDWDENDSLRKFITQDAQNVVSNLKLSNVFVSLRDSKRTEPVSESGRWNLYRESDKPSIIRTLIQKVFRTY